MANANRLSRGPAKEKKIIMNCYRAYFYGHMVVPDERLLCYPTRNIFQVDGYLSRSVTQLVKQNVLSSARMNVYARIWGSNLPELGGQLPPDPPSRTPMR